MSTLQTKTSNTPKQRRLPFWTGCFTILLVSPFLLYYGYCWGLWGRSSLLLQYLFQCNCPTSSEEARYPKEVDVIVPACRNGGVILSPSGRLLYVYVREKNKEVTFTYLVDLQTKEKIPINLPEGRIYFLTDDLIYIFVWFGGSHEGGEHIFDRKTNSLYPIQGFAYSHPGSYINGDADLNKLTAALRQAREIYFVKNSTDTVLALMSDFDNYPENSFFFDRFDIPGRDPERVEKFLQQNNIVYTTVPAHFPEDAVSPDGRFIARHDGIYLFDTGEKIEDGYFVRKFLSRQYFSVRGWMYDSSGVIYSKFLKPCLIELGLGIEYHTCYYEVPQPVLKLKVPEEYLSSTQTP